jgi:Highly conserved protein containing a thioredoxin domain
MLAGKPATVQAANGQIAEKRLAYSQNKSTATNGIKEVDMLLKTLGGSFRPIVCQYNETKLVATHPFIAGEAKNDNSKWICSIKTTPTSDRDGNALDVKLTFKFANGVAKSVGVAAAFDFTNWSTDNYLMIPASVYNGNRYRAIGNGYNPDYPKDMYYNPDVPLTISNNPRLSLNAGEPSLIELQTTNAATPAVCFYSTSLKKGFILLTEQGTRLGNNGITIEENAAHNQASIKISIPSVRSKACGFGDFFPSGDRAADWNKGDEVSLNFKLYAFKAQSIPDLLTKFMAVRKALTGQNHPRNLVPMSKLFELTTAICSNNWITVSAGSYYMPENNKDFQLGWVSGMMNTYPMLALNNQKERERVAAELDFVVDKLQGKSGFFYGGITANGEIRPEKMIPEVPQIHAMVRKNCDALLWMIKHFMLLKEQGYGNFIKPRWENAAKKLAQAFVATWKKYGQFGQYIDPETGEIAVFNSTGGAIAPAALALASDYFGEKEFLQVAKDAANYYYNRDIVEQGLTGGHCGDISQDADSESCFGFLESLMALYSYTLDPQWLEKAQVQAALCATWTMSYDIAFPPTSQIGMLKSNMAGAVWASIQNKHSAPGICTASGDYIFKLYRATGNKLYADLIRDIQHAHTEAVDMPDHRTTNYGFGTSMERIQPSDAEGKGGVGNYINTRNSWTETNGALMDIEIPGIYLQTDKNVLYVFDHVEVNVLKSDKRKTALSISNKTAYDAKVSILTETAEQAKQPLSYVAFTKWPKVSVKAGETLRVTISPNGELNAN